MATAVQVQYRRGTASQVAAFTGAAGEMVVDTTNNRVVVQDGATVGGFPAAKLSEVLTNTRAAISDANYTASTTDRTIAYTAITAARTVTLPAASAFPTGTRLLVVDESGSCSAANTITLSAAGTDKINGAATAAINSARGYLAIESDGSGKWTIVDQPGGGSGVSSLNALTGALSIAATDGTSILASGTSVSIGGPGGTVNKFRNGTMDVWQRGTSSLTATTSGAYAADGWIVLPAGASVTASQAAGRLLTKSSLQVTGASSVTDLIIKQRIESLIAAAFCSQTVTVQAQVYNNTGGSITPTLTVKHAGSQDSWGSPTTDVNAVSLQACANGAWTQVAYTFSANASSYNGLEISFDFGNNFGANTKSVQITECDIRVTPGASTGLNSNPPPPELRPVAVEMPFCLRYLFVKQLVGSGTPAASFGMVNSAGTSAYLWIPFPGGSMRATPSVSYSATSDWYVAASGFSGGAAASSISVNSATNADVLLTVGLSSSLTAGIVTMLYPNNTSARLYFSAEL